MRYIQFTQPNYRGTASYRVGGRVAGFDNELDWFFGSALNGLADGTRDAFPVDIYEDKENTYVRAEIPGVSRESVGVEYADGTLSISASRKVRTPEGEKDVALSRQVGIADQVQGDKVSAAYENGVLTVTLPRKEEAKPRKINVSVN